MSTKWGDMNLDAMTIEMPPAEQYISEVELIPKPSLMFVAAEHQIFGSDDVFTLNYSPVSKTPYVAIRDAGMVAYTEDVDYTINYTTGVVSRIPTGAIGQFTELYVDYYYKNLQPSTLLMAAGRKRQQITMDCVGSLSEYNSIKTDYQDTTQRTLTLPDGSTMNSTIFKIPRATIQPGMTEVWFSISFIET